MLESIPKRGEPVLYAITSPRAGCGSRIFRSKPKFSERSRKKDLEQILQKMVGAE
jgi:hypothetical protein